LKFFILVLRGNFDFYYYFQNKKECITRFSIDDEITRQYRRFNATGTQLTVRLLPPHNDDDDPMSHFVASMNEYALRDFADWDMVGLSISNEEHVQDKAIGLSFR
jgi:hypothetical protein